MQISITKETDNKLFGRKEILFTASSSGSKTPSRDEVKEEICKKLSLNPDMTTVIKITQAYGSNSSDVIVYSYSNKEAMEGLTRKPKKAATAPAKAVPVEEKPEAKKEAPAEEKKEHKEKHEEPKEGKKEAPKEKHEQKKEEKKEETKK